MSNHTRYYTAYEINRTINSLENPALIVGNGINEEAGVFKGGWEALLLNLAHEMDNNLNSTEEAKSLFDFVKSVLSKNNQDVSLVELYDWLLIRYEELMIQMNGPCKENKGGYSSKKSINNILVKIILEGRELLINRLPYDRLLSWCSKKNGEILTTNYDLLFLQSIQKNGKWIKPNEGFCKSTDTFPISRYYYSDNNKIKDKVKIWGVNGYVSLSESLRLSLRDYFNYAKCVRKNGSVYNKKDETWINCFANKSLVFAGINLDSQELILRTLLIERKRKSLVDNGKDCPKSFYIQYNQQGKEGMTEIKREFLKDLGVEVLELADGEKLSECFL